MMPLEKFQSC